jgi:type II secretory pathway pseudopilin PulG
MQHQTRKAESHKPDFKVCQMDATCEVNYPRGTRSDFRDRGIALLLAMIIIIILSGLAVSLVLLTDSQVRLGQTAQAQGRVFYAALAGLAEARGRMNGSAPDTITSLLPISVSQVLYIVNSRSSDPVQPTNPMSPYYDSEYSNEFTGGFASVTVLPNINSDQPGAGTSTAIPYKWVRITLMSEASAHRDINQDGVLTSTPIYWDGTQQTLSSAGGSLVFVLTALAVDSTKVMKILQTEVAGTPGGGTFAPLAPMATASSLSVTGNSSSPNIFVDGTDHNTGDAGCPAPVAALPGILSGGAATVSSASVTGNPATQSNVAPFPQSVSSLLSQFQTSATAITSADPSHVTSSGTGYTAYGTTLGTQPSGGNPGTVAVVYADNPLTIIGGANSGYGVLLVNGNLTVIGDFNYQGVMIVNGQVNFTPFHHRTIVMSGAVLGAGVVTLNASSGLMNPQIKTWYNSCVVAQALQGISGGISSGSSSPTTSPLVLSYRELSY